MQLLEGYEYRYKLNLDPQYSPVTTDKPEVFEPDTEDGLAGRLRPGLHTGWLSVGVSSGTRELGRAALEVRSRKLDYLQHYQWMLRDIATEFTEVVMERFAATEQRFQAAGTTDAVTIYQRFAFLRSLLAGGEFQAAVHQVIARPHVAWEEEVELRPPGRGLKPSSRLGQLLSGPGRRVDVAPLFMGLHSMPQFIPVSRTEVTVDNTPNRFVRFALTAWRDVAMQTADILRREAPSAPVRRGLGEAESLQGELDALLSEELFREVGTLQHFPADNQVLQKREGYRDIFRAYIQFEVAAKLTWHALEDSYRAGQRNVATLYEYWVFIQLAKVVAEFCGGTFDIGSILERDGLNIGLRQGRETVIRGIASHLGRQLQMELTFNRTFFRAPPGTPEGSWTLQLRPDCSLRIGPENEGVDRGFVPVWLHFDAKYRIDSIEAVFRPDSTDETEILNHQESETQSTGAARKDDVLKMHAYRDAIKRSAGAYVLYPGEDVHRDVKGEKERWPEYHEILPGVGAFALRPARVESEQAEGVASLRTFIRDVLDHVASQITRHERGRYWMNRVHEDNAPPKKRMSWAPFLARPPADTWVAVAYVANPDEFIWIHAHRLFPIPVDRAIQDPEFDPRVLTADLVLGYGPVAPPVSLCRVLGEPELLTGSQLSELGYPSSESQFYYCLRLEPVAPTAWSEQLSVGEIMRVRERVRSGVNSTIPIAVTWFDLVV